MLLIKVSYMYVIMPQTLFSSQQLMHRVLTVMGRICFSSKLILIIALLFRVFASHVVSDVTVTISRRLSGDIITYNISGSTSHITCNEDNPTFLVSDKRCVKNQDLIRGKLYDQLDRHTCT